MLFDTHCHPILAKDKDMNEIIKTFKNENKEGFLNIIWTNIEWNKKTIELAKKYDFVYVSIWIHPSDVNLYDDFENTILEFEKQLIENKEKVIWIWECWLDYYYFDWLSDDEIKNEKEKQKRYFVAQLELAKKYNLPVIIHNRNSKDDIFQVLQETNFKNFVLHCYTENLEFAQKLIDFSPDCKISFSWIVTFKNAKEIQLTAINIPLKNILIETDSPYLTPTPLRWKEENEPSFTKYVLDFISEIRDEDSSEIKKQIFENSLEFFGIPLP